MPDTRTVEGNTMNDGGPAFPVRELDEGTGHIHAQYLGLTLRDYFAGQAIAGMLANPNGLMVKDRPVTDEKSYSFAAYALADAMLRARENLP